MNANIHCNVINEYHLPLIGLFTDNDNSNNNNNNTVNKNLYS